MNCGSTDPFPRRRVIKLVLSIAAVITLTAFGYYLYGRAQELHMAEQRARAVGDRVFEVRPDAAVVGGAPGQDQAGEGQE